MADPFIGEIRTFAGGFAPRDWAFCDGQLLSIFDHPALFSLIGTFYGGNGRTDFALPDLRDRFVVGEGRGPGLASRRMGDRGGQARVTLTEAQMPAHDHGLAASSTDADERGTANPERAVPANTTATGALYADGGSLVDLDSTNVAGGGGDHENRQPYQAVTFIIALEGVFPTRS